MEVQKKFCSFQGHEKVPANIYCISCKIYMCQKCESFHSKLLSEHKIYDIDKINSEDISQQFCKQERHNLELQYFCRNHNILCCAKCITKIRNKENGIHKDCNVCTIEEIKNEKLNKLNENIKNLEILSKNLEGSLNKLKDIYEKINQNKEDIKTQIQKIFTKIRNELNKREDFLLQEVEDIFKKKFFGEEIIKQGEKLPNKVKKSLDKCKGIEYNNEENKIISLINDCTNIEENINEINKINDSISKNNDLGDTKVIFYPLEGDDSQLNILIKDINIFGNVCITGELFTNSSIINKDINKINLLIKWLKEKIKTEVISSELIFRMSKDGDKSEDFHKFCDNQGPTLVIIQTTSNKIFGGFTPLNWKSTEEKPIDKNYQTFIFSLDLNKKYDQVKINSQAIKCSKEFGPNFGNDDIELKKNLKDGICYADNSCNFICGGKTELLGSNNNNETFSTKELEVFKIIY